MIDSGNEQKVLRLRLTVVNRSIYFTYLYSILYFIRRKKIHTFRLTGMEQLTASHYDCITENNEMSEEGDYATESMDLG